MLLTAVVAVAIGIALLIPSLSDTAGGRERWLTQTHMTEKNLGGWNLRPGRLTGQSKQAERCRKD